MGIYVCLCLGMMIIEMMMIINAGRMSERENDAGLVKQANDLLIRGH